MRTATRPNTADQIVLFHLSDLHIGTCLMPSPETFNWSLKSGLFPHDIRLCGALEDALDHARDLVGLQEEEPINVIISGDLTKAGTDNDYATAFALLHERWRWRLYPRERWIGFGWPRDWVHSVPGNHDHWRVDGRPTAFTPNLAPDWFDVTPWEHTIESQSKALRLELFGVDSNAGFQNLSSPGQWNLGAGGKLSPDERKLLLKLLNKPAPTPSSPAVIRVLVCHHPFSNAGYFDVGPLDLDSRDYLCRLAERHDIATVLTGHLHAFDVRDWPLPTDRSRVLKELRCGTTLQGTTSKPGLQGFWVHQITRAPQAAGWLWTAWKYQEAAKMFDVDLSAPIRFIVPTVRTSPDS